jgi:L,D-transpeptidase-like protein/putative peptidoglycan binding protein
MARRFLPTNSCGARRAENAPVLAGSTIRLRSSPAAALLALSVAAVLGAGTAGAQTPPITTPTTPTPAPKPAGGKLSLTSRSGLPTRKLRYVSRGQKVKVTGFVRPFVAGQVVSVQARSHGRIRARKTLRVRKASKGRGKFVFRFVARRRGSYAVTAHHAATAAQKAFSGRLGKRFKTVILSAGLGSRGTKVVLLQRGLRSLGYLTPLSGSFDAGTARAVLAFRKVNRLGRASGAGTFVYKKVLRGQGRFRLRHPKAGRHVEFDWSRQVVVLADKGRARYVVHASSGKPSTPTVFGTFHFYSKTPGTNSHGMVHSNYFIGGYAIHGYADVPNYPASHGCIRIPIPSAGFVYGWIKLGMTIFVYR